MTLTDPTEVPTLHMRGAVLLPCRPTATDPPTPTVSPSPPAPRGEPGQEQSRSLLHPNVLLVASVGAVSVVWGVALWLSVHVEADQTLRSVALFAHLSALVAGFGAVLVVDWGGLLWMLGKRRLIDVLSLADTCHAVIWFGLVGLTVSGALLHPDLTALRTQVKLGVVLVLALNGVQAFALQRQLDALTGPPGRGLLVRSTVSASLSQAGWWTATVIGFLTHNSH